MTWDLQPVQVAQIDQPLEESTSRALFHICHVLSVNTVSLGSAILEKLVYLSNLMTYWNHLLVQVVTKTLERKKLEDQSEGIDSPLSL